MKRLAIVAMLLAASASAQITGWGTPAEKADFRRTPNYEETMAYIRRIAAAAPKQIRLEPFGTSGEGRRLWTVIVSKDGVFEPAAIRRAKRPIVLVQNGIHAGEIDGKDATLALLREMLITKSQAALMDRAVLVFIPIYNVDGHERVSRYNRINQNGPDEMGWRTTATNLNLNRDYMKADAVETRAFLKLWNKWLPDFFIDNHVTDGHHGRRTRCGSGYCEMGAGSCVPVCGEIRRGSRPCDHSISRVGRCD
jgi:murein tripeptide amidase MpaA